MKEVLDTETVIQVSKSYISVSFPISNLQNGSSVNIHWIGDKLFLYIYFLKQRNIYFLKQRKRDEQVLRRRVLCILLQCNLYVFVPI